MAESDSTPDGQWREEEVLQLISLYEKFDILWDPGHPQHYNKSLKEDAWWAIENTMRRKCKDKMVSVQGSYRRERSKMRKTFEDGEKLYKTHWFAFEALQFLERKEKRKVFCIGKEGMKKENRKPLRESKKGDQNTQLQESKKSDQNTQLQESKKSDQNTQLQESKKNDQNTQSDDSDDGVDDPDYQDPVSDESENDIDQTSPAIKKIQSFVNKIPSVVNKTPSAVNKTPSVVNKTPSAVNKIPSVVNKTPSAVNKTPSAVKQTSPMSENYLTSRLPKRPAGSNDVQNLQPPPKVPKSSDDSAAVDAFDRYGQHIADRLREINPSQIKFVQKLISDVLFEGETESLDRTWKLTTTRHSQMVNFDMSVGRSNFFGANLPNGAL